MYALGSLSLVIALNEYTCCANIIFFLFNVEFFSVARNTVFNLTVLQGCRARAFFLVSGTNKTSFSISLRLLIIRGLRCALQCRPTWRTSLPPRPQRYIICLKIVKGLIDHIRGSVALADQPRPLIVNRGVRANLRLQRAEHNYIMK